MSLGIGVGLGVGPVLGDLLVDGFGWPAAFVFGRRCFSRCLLPHGRPVAGAAPVPRRLLAADLLRLPVLRAGLLAFLSQYAQFAVWLLIPFFLVGARGSRPAWAARSSCSPARDRARGPLGGSSPIAWGALAAARRAGLRGGRVAAIGAVTRHLDRAGRRRHGPGGLRSRPLPGSNLALMMAAFPPAQQGAAGGLAFLGRTLGSAVGVQATALLFGARLPRDGFLAAFHAAFFAAGAVCVLAAGLALLPSRPAASRGAGSR
jgi:hypothetical protein